MINYYCVVGFFILGAIFGYRKRALIRMLLGHVKLYRDLKFHAKFRRALK